MKHRTTKIKFWGYCQVMFVVILISGINGVNCCAQSCNTVDNGNCSDEFNWPQGTKAAISLSFDDARPSQVDNGVPILDRYGIKATFYANPESLTSRLEKWKEAAKNGHEIANHTSNHPCTGNYAFSRNNALEDYTLETIAENIDNANDSIEMLIGIRPSTFAYPCGQTFVGRGKKYRSYVPVVASRFIAGRGWFRETPNDPTYCDLANICAKSSDQLNFQQIKKVIDETIEKGGWLVLCGHDIKPEGKRQTTNTTMLEELCAYISKPENGLWVAPVSDVANYVKENRIEKDANIVLLHHSTGKVIYNGNTNEAGDKTDIPGWFSAYNNENGTSYTISEQAFPKDKPYGWRNYPYDYYNIWVKNAGNKPYQGEPTLEILTQGYDVIIFKHCFPVSRVGADEKVPDIDSPKFTQGNYKLQYNALKEKMQEFPNTRFIVWTGAVLTQSKSSPENAERARAFFDWVKDEWDEVGDNIFVWDFYELETEGGLYLKDEYAVSPEDPHPNKRFAAKVLPLFGQRIVDVIENNGKKTNLKGELN